MNESLTVIPSHRKKQIAKDYLRELDQYILDLKQGKVDYSMEIREFAELLHIHPVHLSATIKEVTGQTTCQLFEERLVRVSKELLQDADRKIADIARQLTYDPSNFTKFFKHYTGITPKQYRQRLANS